LEAEQHPQPRTSGDETPPRARALFRQGAVYGLAGAMKAADVAMAAARGAMRGARQGVAVADREPPPDE